jgi:non-canonical (house-cleaning) NTP pyrophosphatase
VIFDGSEYYIGLSEVPRVAAGLVINDGVDMNAAFHTAGLTVDPVIGVSDGAVGIATGGQVNRLELMKQAIRMAFLPYTVDS